MPAVPWPEWLPDQKMLNHFDPTGTVTADPFGRSFKAGCGLMDFDSVGSPCASDQMCVSPPRMTRTVFGPDTVTRRDSAISPF